MGGPKTKTSRKGKKAWRKNIDASEVIAKRQKQQHYWQSGFACCMRRTERHSTLPMKLYRSFLNFIARLNFVYG
jgi:hypothetical protein